MQLAKKVSNFEIERKKRTKIYHVLNGVLNSFLYMLILFSLPALHYGLLITIIDQVLKKYK
jgi:hypothetical protein